MIPTQRMIVLAELKIVAKVSVPDKDSYLHGAFVVQGEDKRYDWIPEAQQDKIPLNQRFLKLEDCLTDAIKVLQIKHGG